MYIKFIPYTVFPGLLVTVSPQQEHQCKPQIGKCCLFTIVFQTSNKPFREKVGEGLLALVKLMFTTIFPFSNSSWLHLYLYHKWVNWHRLHSRWCYIISALCPVRLHVTPWQRFGIVCTSHIGFSGKKSVWLCFLSLQTHSLLAIISSAWNLTSLKWPAGMADKDFILM